MLLRTDLSSAGRGDESGGSRERRCTCHKCPRPPYNCRDALASCTKRTVSPALCRTQRVPYVVPTTASLARTYRLFRDLGLHHILVTPPSIPVVGLITRTDISAPNAYKASCCACLAWCDLKN